MTNVILTITNILLVTHTTLWTEIETNLSNQCYVARQKMIQSSNELEKIKQAQILAERRRKIYKDTGVLIP